ncbi:GATOR complex protein WDR24-like isoform X2 [Ruditapes philippinarum]|uniref:GATOR complex protein WDR24-like isoform X2 n=1 Tax=Ruditapes philippinarum TaxID=129788 RepID=UPI00295B2EEF|nr:GATOR complex protein WDR24-like isoform X2 [Ruditapes philippinarum]
MQTVQKIVHDRVTSSNPQTMFINCGGAVSTIAQNKDASQVVVGGRNVFKIYSVDDECFEEKYNLRVGKHVNLNYCASDIAWNHTDDHILATGATNGAVVIWDLSRMSRSKQEHIFQEHKRTVNRVCFHENEHKLLLSASQDGSMKLFDLRKKEVSLNFSSGSTSVRDIMFSPCNLNYFGFASADESGNLMIWDMRRPDRYEKLFPAHSGPVFSVNWHPEDKNLFATAGRDKMIKVWDLSKQKCIYTIYSIASVARIKWRPQRRFHIASCSLLVDCSINIWDIRRPYVPFATFDNHIDVTTSMLFKNKDPHVMLSGSKDSYLYQHVFRDAKRPGEELVPAGLDFSVYGTVGHANSDKQGKLNSIGEGSGIMSGLLTKKSTERNDHFVDVTAYMQVFSDTGQVVPIEDLSWMVMSAKNYKLEGHSVEELCKHNSKVAQSLHRGQVAQAWLLVLTLYCTHIVESKNLHVNRTSSVISSVLTEKIDIDKNKQAKEPETDVDDKNMDGTSGNSDDDMEDKELFDAKLSNIARGQINTDWDIFFGDGDPGSFDLNEDIQEFSDSKQEWILPSEAFNPRHEIPDETCKNPKGSTQKGGPETRLDPAIESEIADNVEIKGTNDKYTNNLLSADMQLMQNHDWEFVTIVTDMMKNFAAEGDVQTPVCMLIVLKDKVRKFIEPNLQEDWFFSYIELLGRFKLWTIANFVIKLSNLHHVSILNQQSTTIHVNCNTCQRPLHRSGWLCDRCKNIINQCCVCHLPVKGLFLWCQGCSHGGHLQHVKDWFSRNAECPTGCGHVCEYT